MVDEMQLKGICLPLRNEDEKEIDYNSIFEWIELERKNIASKKKRRKSKRGEEVIIEEEKEDEEEE